MYSAPCGSMNITAINQKSVYTHTTCKPCNTKNTRNTAFHTSAKTKTLQQNHNRKKIYIQYIYIYIPHLHAAHNQWGVSSRFWTPPLGWKQRNQMLWEKHGVWKGGSGDGGGPVASSPSLLSREDKHEEIRIWSFCAFHGLMKRELLWMNLIWTFS